MPSRLLSPLPIAIACSLVVSLGSGVACADPTASSIALFNTYASSVELRLEQQHRSNHGFLTQPVDPRDKPRDGLIIERLSASATNSPDAMLHHWRATAFVPGATAEDVERVLRTVGAYPSVFAPQVLQTRVLHQSGDQMSLWMRLRERHVLTVVLDSTYDVTFGRLDQQHRYSISRSTHISEIEAPGTPAEHALRASGEHGFLWRQMTCWSYEQRDGGVYLQLESISLTRAIPRGLAWAVRPYVESIPRDSLTFTLRSVMNALKK